MKKKLSYCINLEAITAIIIRIVIINSTIFNILTAKR